MRATTCTCTCTCNHGVQYVIVFTISSWLAHKYAIAIGTYTVETFNFYTSRPDNLPVHGCTTSHGEHPKNKPSITMNHVACESKIRSVVRLSMHPRSANWVVVWRAAVYCAQASHASSAGIKCQHSR